MTGRTMAPVEVCQECQRCCKRFSMGFSINPPMRELMQAHYGREIESVRYTIHHKCQHLTDSGKCDLWHENEAQDKRPQICKEYMCEKAETPGMLMLDVSAWEG